MFSVEETTADGRRRTLTARTVPADPSSGAVRFAVGSISGRPPVIPAPWKPVDDLEALAVAVGVMG
ncbi:hypothetical protein [Streptomyces sp. CA2R106]|uniref:hypothetical protein n=1 Tax=Streptomyces sp. CA2R106 TaxID=3120153 RepID=UPI003008BD7A